MHEHGCDASLAAVCSAIDEPPENGQAQRPDARRPLVAGGPQHGAGLADSAESSARQGQCPQAGQADMGGVRTSVRIHRRDEGESRTEKRLASVGLSASERREPLHPQTGPALAGVPAPRGAVSVENVLRLLEHQRYRCALTGRRLTPESAALDHIVPVRHGGGHVIENTQALHKDVNRAKGALTNEEFRAMCREVVAWGDCGKAHVAVREGEERA